MEKYLRTASKLYRYSFKEQLLIHAQRPDATACATAEQWSGKMNCWVNRGSIGIALIDEDSPYKKLRYVFDVSDVHPSHLVGRLPRIWEMKERDEGAVIRSLGQTYGSAESGLSFEEQVLEIAAQVAEDSFGEMIPEIRAHSAKTRMDGLEDEEIGRRAKSALEASLAYTLLVRCGADVEKWEGRLDFSHVRDFNSMALLDILGVTASDLSRPILMEIGRAVEAHEKTIVNKVSRNTALPQREFRVWKGEGERLPQKHGHMRNLPKSRNGRKMEKMKKEGMKSAMIKALITKLK